MTQDGVKLGGFRIKPKAKPTRNLVYLHGIGFNAKSKLLRLIEYADHLHAEIIMFNYRGYAYSDPAKCSEAAIMIDAQAMLDWC